MACRQRGVDLGEDEGIRGTLAKVGDGDVMGSVKGDLDGVGIAGCRVQRRGIVASRRLLLGAH